MKPKSEMEVRPWGILYLREDGGFWKMDDTCGWYVEYPCTNMESGFIRINLYNWKTKKVSKHLLHLLMAEAYLGEPPYPGCQVRFHDGDKTNCHKDNLYYYVNPRKKIG